MRKAFKVKADPHAKVPRGARRRRHVVRADAVALARHVARIRERPKAHGDVHARARRHLDHG